MPSDSSNSGRSPSPTRRTFDGLELPLEIYDPAGTSSTTGVESQLFSSFASLGNSLSLGKPKESVITGVQGHLSNKDIGVLNKNLITIGYGSSFIVSRVTDLDLDENSPGILGLDLVAFKRTIPSLVSESQHKRQKQIKSLMLELRVLAHEPIQKHENIVDLLGIAWETDHLDFSRKWPVLIMERATKGTLSNFLDPSDPKSFQIKVALALDVVFGLKVLHQCGILHGDIKADNVLIFENRDPNTRSQRPVIAKLGDFSGVLFDMKGLMELPSGTRPWNAPEWRQLLTPESLLMTDVYSLGFLIFIIMVDGKHPFRDFSPCYATGSSWDQVESLKCDSQLLEHMKSLSGFHEDVDVSVLHSIFDCTLCSAPKDRSLDKVEAILQEAHYHRRASIDFGGLTKGQIQLRDTVLPFSFPGIDYLDHGIAQHVAAELERMSNDKSHPESIPEAAYGLAVLSINGVTGAGRWETRKKEGLKWLEIAAQSGSDRAQAWFVRACGAFGARIPVRRNELQCELSRVCFNASCPAFASMRTIVYIMPPIATAGSVEKIELSYSFRSQTVYLTIPDSCKDLIKVWLRDTACRGFFTALDDLAEFGYQEELKESTAVLRKKYGGVGASRFDEYFPHDSFESFDRRLSSRVADSRPVDSILTRARDNVLHFAASCGLESTMEKLINSLDQKALDIGNARDETALLLACRSGHCVIAMMLLEAGANPLLASIYGETPLHWLLSFEDRYVDDVAQKLSDRQVHIDAVAQQFSYVFCGENSFIAGTPLMRAVARNKLKAANALLRLGADPNFTHERTSAINIAASLHYHEILDLLLCSSSHSPRTVERSTGQSLLIPTIAGGSLMTPGSLFGRICRHGHLWRSRGQESLRVLLKHGAGDHLHSVPGMTGTTALYHAVTFAESDIVKFLLQNGCAEHVNIQSTVPYEPKSSRPPLAMAVFCGKLETFQLLLEYGADATQTFLLDEPEPSQPVTLLFYCAWVANDNPFIAQALLDSGVPVDESPAGFETPFGCALRNRCFALADCLRRNRADVNREYVSGSSTIEEYPMSVLGHLLRECLVGTLACLNFLFQPRDLPGTCQPDFLVFRSRGLTALHAIAKTQYERQDDRALEMILDCIMSHFKPSQEQLDAVFSVNRYTALHIAVLNANWEAVRRLLNEGADYTLKDSDGCTVLELAERCIFFLPEHANFKLEKSPDKGIRNKRGAIIKLLEAASSANAHQRRRSVDIPGGPVNRDLEIRSKRP